jgi:hypothetical protein
MNHSGQHVMVLSEFPNTPSKVILHFGGQIGDRSICGEISLLPFVSPTLLFDEPLFLHSHQSLVMVNLLDNFLNPLKLFWAVASNFTKLS